MAQQLNGRRGANHSVRISTRERALLEAERLRLGGPDGVGPWLLWRALRDRPGTATVPWQPALELRLTVEAVAARPDVPISKRKILDLCGGKGRWSEPYRKAGYPVEVVTLPELDVRDYVPPGPWTGDEIGSVWGVLAAPPCEGFSLAHPTPADERDLVEAMACVNACLRIVQQAQPRWWALENPVGLLSRFLGPPQDCFEPHEFGDPWTKETQLWGRFVPPARGPRVKPKWGLPPCTEGHGNALSRKSAGCSEPACRAKTPPGFARAFAEANP